MKLAQSEQHLYDTVFSKLIGMPITPELQQKVKEELASYYSPAKPIIICDDSNNSLDDARSGVLVVDVDSKRIKAWRGLEVSDKP